jgi:hypothetical protein
VTEDPRLAALAAALPNALTYSDHHPYDLDPIGSAAAILAALPPDWCGHRKLVSEQCAAQDACGLFRRVVLGEKR